MAKTKEEMQDNALRNIDRVNRHNKTEVKKLPTLKEQLAEFNRTSNQSASEKLKELSWEDWENELRKFIFNYKLVVIPQSSVNWIIRQKDRELREQHRKGTPFKAIVTWMEEFVEDHQNL